MEQKKLAFIGAGNMAFAVISGLIRSGYPAHLITACNKHNESRRAELRALGVQIGESNRSAVEQADVVILAVKPQMMAEVCGEFSDCDFSAKWLISVAAGISVARLRALLPTAKTVIRTMPNTPALISAGLTGWFAEKNSDPAACRFAEQLLAAVGQSYRVAQESDLNKIIALTGSSPAYFFRFMEAMQQQALEMGFTEQDARFLVQSAALGSAQLVAANPSLSLATLRENVTSKGGTTAKALEVFDQSGLDEIVGNAMAAAIARAQEMEKSL